MVSTGADRQDVHDPVHDRPDVVAELLWPLRLKGYAVRRQAVSTAPVDVRPGSGSTQLVLVDEGACVVEGPAAGGRLATGGLLLALPGTTHRLREAPHPQTVKGLGTVATAGFPRQSSGSSSPPRCQVLSVQLHHAVRPDDAIGQLVAGLSLLSQDAIRREPLLGAVVTQALAAEVGHEPGDRTVRLRTWEMVLLLALRRLLVEHACRASASPLVLPGHPLITRALGIMQGRYAEAWTTESLAREVGMSRSAFAMAFRELVGEAPGRHLTARRMRESARLLLESELPLSSLAPRVGYASVVGFHAAFRRWFAMTPGEYRRAALELTPATHPSDPPKQTRPPMPPRPPRGATGA